MPIDQPQEEEPPDVVEMRSSGPWPETEINTTSGNEASEDAHSNHDNKTENRHYLLLIRAKASRVIYA